MARAKRCEEEFNPWPPFVDVFSSVVLVLLLFILVLIVNVAYYTQFNSKTDSNAQTKSQKNNMNAGVDIQDMIALHKIEKPKMDAGGNDALFSGGEAEGNGLERSKKQDQKPQDVKTVAGKTLMIAYRDNNVFLRGNAVKRVKAFAKKARGKKVIISAAFPKDIISTTMKKRITVSRLIDVKTKLQKAGIPLSDIKIRISTQEDAKYPDGYVKIELR